MAGPAKVRRDSGSLSLAVAPVPPHSIEAEQAVLGGLRVATSDAGLLERHVAGHDVEADIVRLDGAVESSVGLGVITAHSCGPGSMGAKCPGEPAAPRYRDTIS